MNKVAKMMLLNQKNTRGQDYDRDEYDRRHRGRMDYDRMGREDRHTGLYGREPHGREMYMEGRVKMPEQDYELDEETAKEWTRHMENADGTKGPHWSMDQTEQVAAQKNVSENPLEFWVAMNMMYSDYCAMARKYNVNTVDFYVDMAKAFLDDKDAKRNKLARYYYAVIL